MHKCLSHKNSELMPCPNLLSRQYDAQYDAHMMRIYLRIYLKYL